MKKFSKVTRIIVVVLALAILIGAVVALSLMNREQELEKLQNEALSELEKKKGEYDEGSIVLYETSPVEARQLAEKFGATLRISIDGRFAALSLPEGTTILDIYADDANREYIEKMSADYSVRVSELTAVEGDEDSGRLPVRPNYNVSDTLYSSQGYLDYVNVGDAWSKTTGSGVTVAVIDTGIDTDHPEFAGRISEYSYNASEDKIVKDYILGNGEYDWSLIEDEQGHGTAVTGVIASQMNGTGVVGLAPNVNIIVIKVECDQNGAIKRSSDLVFGLYYAIERDVSVVNMSFGGPIDIYAEAAQLAFDSDIVCIAAAGNDATTALTFPAATKNVFGVGALADDSWTLAEYSNYGENADLVAPGSTFTTLMGGEYGVKEGTSLASPIVTAAVALYMSQNRYVEVKTFEEQLYASCYDLGSLGEDWIYGYGALDVNALICEERGKVTFNMLTDELENTEQVFIRNHTLQNIPEPERLYAVFDGWYYDAQCTEEYNWYADEFSADLTLYANWVNEDDGVPFTYVELEDGTIEIRSYTGKRRFITIPDMIDGKVVSSIGDFAFYGQSRLRQVGLPSGLRNIGLSAFEGCLNLIDIVIPEGVTKIGEKAFKDNVRLYTVIFEGESKLVSIGDLAFSNCSSLERIELPASLEKVNGSAFFGANELEAITVRNTNKFFKSVDGVLFNIDADTLVAYPAGKYGEYTIPDTVKSIGVYAFALSKFKEIELSGIESIGAAAFAYSRLESVDIPDSVTSMGKQAFNECYNLKRATIGAGLSSIPCSGFASTALTEINIPSGIVEIGESAFAGSPLRSVTFAQDSKLITIGGKSFKFTNLTSINIPKSVQVIGACAFSGTLLSEVTFGEDSELLLIGDTAFENTIFLKNIVLPEKLQVIGEHAFMSSGLTTVTIPASVYDLGIGPFADCDDLTEIKVADGNAVYKDIDGVVYTIDEKTLVKYPAGKNGSTYNVPEGVEVIGIEAFYGSDILNYVYLPQTLVNISEGAFYSCTELRSMDIPDSVLQIGRLAFSEDWKLSSVYISDNTKMARIGYQAFANCGLTYMHVPANISTMAQGAFEGCSKLTSFTFAKNSKLESISAYMFDGCDNLQSITFEHGSALTSVQAHGLEGMRKLRNIDFGDAKITNIDNFAFRFCESLVNVDLPDTVVNIGRFAFYECNSLSELYIPSGIEHIGRYAFWGTDDINLYFDEEEMPPYLDEYWDEGIRSYHMGVSEVIVDGDFKYALLDDGNISIVEYIGEDTAVDLSALDLGGDIVAIGGKAFYLSDVTDVKLPETLVTIQAEAFAGSKLESVAIPASVEFIGREAFFNCEIVTLEFDGNSNLRVIEHDAFAYTKNLKSAVIPKSVETLGTAVFEESGITTLEFEEGTALTKIPERAFAGTSISAVAIPDSVTLIDHSAFRDNMALSSVDFGNGESIHIGSNVFYNTGLKSVNIPANIGYIGEYAFVGLENLTEFTVDESNPYYKAVDGVLMSKDGRKLIAFPAGREGSYTVPVHVEIIGFGAFENSKLSNIAFNPNANILTFGYRAFFGAKNIKSFTVLASVVSIDYYAFANCTALEKVTFAEGNKLKGIYEGAFYGCKNLNDITIPDSIVEISDFAFYGCIALDRIPVSESSGVLGIYDYAFAYTGIKELDLPETLIDIGNYAFMGLRVKEITVPDTNAKQLIIGIGAFEDCQDLEEITLPFIGAGFEDPDYSWFGYIFGAGGYEANATYVPESLKKVTITEGISTVGYGGFYNITSIEEIDVPHSVTMLEPYSFGGTTAIYRLTNEILTVSGYDRFGDPAHFTAKKHHFGKSLSGHLKLAEGVTWIDGAALCECKKLLSVAIPEGVTTIGYAAFRDCLALTEITIPASVTAIYDQAFLDCLNLYVVYNDSDLVFNFDSIDYGYIASHAKLIVDKNGNKTYRNESSEFEYTETEDGFKFLKENGKYKLIAYTGNEDTITLPKSINGSSYEIYQISCVKNVIIPDGMTSIGEKAFYRSALESIVIPDSVTKIGDEAFRECPNLKSIVIPDSVTKIGDEAFRECSNLNSITIPRGVKKINHGLFYGCSNLTTVILKSGVERIGSIAFMGCSNLTNVIIPNTVTDIDGCAFEQCTSLTSITIPDSVKKIGNSAFKDCKNLTSVTIGKSVNTIEFGAFSGCSIESFVVSEENSNFVTIDGIVYDKAVTSIVYVPNNIVSAEIPYGITEIGDSAFYGCSNLTTVIIPDSVTNIGYYAFWGCSSLANISIPDVVESIGLGAFRGCSSLKSIEIPYGVTDISNTIFSGCTSLEKVTIPESVTKISYAAFMNCSSLTSVNIPSGVTSLDSVFSGCSSLTSVVIPDGVTSIRQTFSGCSSLTSVIIPDSVTVIGDMTFYGCEALMDITIPDSVTEIGEAAFFRAGNFMSVTIPKNMVKIGNSAFYDCSISIIYNNSDLEFSFGSTDHGYIAYDAKMIVDKNGNKIYKDDTYTLEYVETEDGFKFMKENGEYKLIEYLGDKDTVTLPKDINGYSYEIYYMRGVRNVIIPEGMTHISDSAFRFCSTLQSITIPNSVTMIGDSAFDRCLSLESIVIPASVTLIGNGSFYGCSNLTSVIIPDSVISIGDSAFYRCTTLTSIIIPDSVTTIESYAFDNCSSLSSIVISDNIKDLGWDVFRGTAFYNDESNWANGTLILDGYLIELSKDTTHFMRRDIKCAAWDAFDGCYKLKVLTIGGNCGEDYAFGLAALTNLETLIITEMPDRIVGYFGRYASALPITLKNIVLADGVKMNSSAFYRISGITIFVEASKVEAQHWDENYPDWNAGNKVVYGDNWIYADFYGADGTLTNSGVFKTSQVIRVPYVKDYTYGINHYTFVGFDINGDGIVDSIPATSSVNISAKAIFSSHCLHSEFTTIIEKEPTCLENGLEANICKYCGERFAEKIVSALGHAEVIDKAIAPTCTETGLTEGKRCDVCGEVLIKQTVVDALGHTEVIDKAVAPTCTTTGLTEGKRCDVCKEVLVKQTVVDALGHTEVIDKAVAPTCTQTGLTGGKYCEVCGDVLVKQTVVEALGHAEVIDKAVAPTCTQTGLTEGKHCDVCGEVLIKQTVVDALGHTEMIDKAVEPTCTESGLTEGKHCDVCGEVLIKQTVVDALGHNEIIDKAVAPTCTESGLTEGKHCDVCGEVLVKQTVVDALGHTEVIDKAVAPTCTETGLTEGKHCDVCGEVLEAQETVEKLAHTPSDWIIDKPAEVGVDGKKHKECVDCGEILEEEVIDALPPEEKPTERPTEEPTEKPTEEVTTNATDGTETEATDATQGESSSSDKPAENEGGCGSALLTMTPVIFVLTLAVIPTFLKNKREE